MVTLPLNPIDLTKIYKSKLEDEEFTLAVNYTESKESLTAKQILIYLSNTAFKCGFDRIDADLLLSYIKTDFLVDAPSLDRVIANILKVKLGEEVSDSFELFGKDDIDVFIVDNEEVVENLILTISSLPVFIMDSVNSLEDGNTSFNHGLEIKESSNKLIGVNLLNVVTNGFDAALAIFSKRGMTADINTNIYNEDSKYKGVDLFKSLFDSGVVYQVLDMLPKSIIQKT